MIDRKGLAASFLENEAVVTMPDGSAAFVETETTIKKVKKEQVKMPDGSDAFLETETTILPQNSQKDGDGHVVDGGADYFKPIPGVDKAFADRMHKQGIDAQASLMEEATKAETHAGLLKSESASKEPIMFKCGCDFGGADVTIKKEQGLDCDCNVAKCKCKKQCECDDG